MQAPVPTMTREMMESIRRDAMAMLIAEGGPASLAGILWTPGSIQLAPFGVQGLALLADVILMTGLAFLASLAPGPVAAAIGGVLWLGVPVLWRLYGRTPGMALFGLYLVHLSRDDAVHPSIPRGIARVLLLCLTVMLVPFARSGRVLAVLATTWPILPADRLLSIRVFRYRLVAPPGRTRVDRVLDRLGIFASVDRIASERQPRDAFGRPD